MSRISNWVSSPNKKIIQGVNRREWLIAVLFLSPVLLFIGVFAFFPAFYAVYLSFFESKFLVFDRHFVGLSNYTSVLYSSEFWKSLYRTVIFTGWSVILQFGLGMWLAIILRDKFKINHFLRAVIIIPWTLSPVVIAIMYQFLYIPDQSGLLNYLLSDILSQPITWLGVDTAMYAVIFANLWFGMPFSLVMLLAGLQSIDESIYEASTIDGANAWNRFRYITLPLLKPTMMVTLVWITISTFNEFDLVYALTGGGPLNQTNLLGIFMYNTAFKFGAFEKGATIAVLMFVINLVLSVIYFKVLSPKE